MNLSIFSTLAGFPKRIIDAARNAIIFVRNTADHLPGDLQHMEAVKILAAAAPNLPKWAAHAVIGATFGWIEKHMPDRLTPAIGAIGDAAIVATDQAIDNLLAPSPFAIPPMPPPNESAVLSPRPVQPIAPIAPPLGVGESLPPPAAPMQATPLRPIAPSGSPA